MLMQLIVIAIQISVVSVTFCELLTREKMIFAFWGRILERIESGRFGWIAYPLGYCSKCTGGQIALWVFVFRLASGIEPVSGAVTRFVFFSSLTVLLSEILALHLKRMQRGA